jgi:hypothetical protein
VAPQRNPHVIITHGYLSSYGCINTPPSGATPTHKSIPHHNPLRIVSLAGLEEASLALAPFAQVVITKAVAPEKIYGSYRRLIYLSTGLSRQPCEGMIRRAPPMRRWTSLR